MFLKGDRVGLQPPQRESIESYLAWMNDLDVLQYILRVRPMGRAEEEEWFANLSKRPDDIVFEIALLDGGKPVGSCGIHRINSSNRSAEVGIVIGDKSLWGKGYGREALGLLCGYGFDVLNLNRVGLSVYAYNARGVRCYERLGFRHEGRSGSGTGSTGTSSKWDCWNRSGDPRGSRARPIDARKVREAMKRPKLDRHEFLRTRLTRQATALALTRRTRPRECKLRARRDGPLIPV